MLQSDSVDKIVMRYFAAVTNRPFTYKERTYHPVSLKVSPLLLRDYTCPPGCGGCCFRFTLDYLPSEDRPKSAKRRWVRIDRREVEIWTDAQEDNETNRCQKLLPDGRCGIYPVRPFSCDFELVRVLQPVQSTSTRDAILTQKLFGRGWSYQRVDGGKGALCEMKPVTDHSTQEVIRKLTRLKEWADHFGLETRIPDILTVIRRGSLTRPIVFAPPGRQLSFDLGL